MTRLLHAEYRTYVEPLIHQYPMGKFVPRPSCYGELRLVVRPARWRHHLATDLGVFMLSNYSRLFFDSFLRQFRFRVQ